MESGFIKYMNRSLRLVRLFGIYPLNHTRESTRLSPGVMLYNVFLIIIFVIGSICWIRKYFFISINNALIVASIGTILGIPITIILLFSRGYKKIDKIFFMIDATEARLTLLGIYCIYGRPRIFDLVLSLICWILSNIFTFFAFTFDTFEETIMLYHDIHAELIIILNLFGFASLLRSLEVQFSSLSNQLLWMIQSNIPIKRKEQMMESVIEIHEELCTICSELSKFYSTLLLFTITASFIKFISFLYWLFWNMNEFARLYHASCALLSLLQVYTVCSSVAELSKKAKKFNTFLYQVMIDDKTNIISDNNKLRLHFYMKREVVFNACGFFNLDYSLVHTMVTATITYLVILIQFGQEEEYGATPAPEMVNTILPDVYNSTLVPH